MLQHFGKLRQNAIRFPQKMGQKKSPKITESLSKRGKKIFKIHIRTGMIFLIILGRHLLMYSVSEKKKLQTGNRSP